MGYNIIPPIIQGCWKGPLLLRGRRFFPDTPLIAIPKLYLIDQKKAFVSFV